MPSLVNGGAEGNCFPCWSRFCGNTFGKSLFGSFRLQSSVLLFHESFPRSVAGALNEIEFSLTRMTGSDDARVKLSELFVDHNYLASTSTLVELSRIL